MNIFFNDRTGNTLLSEEEKQGLKSKLITTMGELDILEQTNINSGMLWLVTKNIKSTEKLLDITFLNTFHKKLFGDVWGWAGEFRKSEKNIGVAPYSIMSDLKNLFEDVKAWVEFKSYPQKEILARFHHRLVKIHAYPNGNGRHARLVTDALAVILLGHDLTWYYDIDKVRRRKEYIKVLRSADIKDFLPLIEYFEKM